MISFTHTLSLTHTHTHTHTLALVVYFEVVFEELNAVTCLLLFSPYVDLARKDLLTSEMVGLSLSLTHTHTHSLFLSRSTIFAHDSETWPTVDGD